LLPFIDPYEPDPATLRGFAFRAAPGRNILALVALLTLDACTRGAASGPSRSARAAPPQAPSVLWNYEVHAIGPRAGTLHVVADLSAGSSDSLGTDDDAARFIRDVRVETPTGMAPVPVDRGTWNVPCRTRGCRVEYTFALDEAAAQIADADTALAAGGVLVAPPSTWLLRPTDAADANGRFRFRVRTEDGARFASGVLPSPGDANDAFAATTAEMDAASFAAFGTFRDEVVRSGHAAIEVALARSGLAIDGDEAIRWIDRAVRGLTSYYRGFPTPRALVIVVPSAPDARGTVEGVTLGDGGPAVVLRAGPRLTGASAPDDWVATHELIHVTLPSLTRDHAWLSEGLATYVEPVVRARAGLVTPERYWGDLVKGLPQGLPEAGDQGLERTHTWGRTYWGGALFCFLADLRIRAMTNGRRSLDDALRGIVATGANVESHWEIERFLDAGDRATGTAVLADLHRTLGFAPVATDLGALWSQLGVHVVGDRVTFDDAAPLAATRRAITDPKAND
jgi:hypothetical protein